MVKLARHVNTGQLVAVKMIDKTKLDVMATSHLLQEVRYRIQVVLKDRKNNSGLKKNKSTLESDFFLGQF